MSKKSGATPTREATPIVEMVQRWNDNAVDRKSKKIVRLNGLIFCSFSVTVKMGSIGGDVTVQKLRNVQNVIVTPACCRLQGLNTYVNKNVIHINYEPCTCANQVINVVAIGQR